MGLSFTGIAIIVVVLYFLSSIKILAEYERGVIFRLGRLLADAKGPGLIFVFAPLDRMVRVSLRQEAMEVPPQDIITRDNVTLKVNAVIFLRVIEPRKAINEVSNYVYQTSQFAQTTLRSVLGKHELDELLSHREKINLRLQSILDTHTAPWGVKVTNVEVKQVDMPETMLRAMPAMAGISTCAAVRTSIRLLVDSEVSDRVLREGHEHQAEKEETVPGMGPQEIVDAPGAIRIDADDRLPAQRLASHELPLLEANEVARDIVADIVVDKLDLTGSKPQFAADPPNYVSSGLIQLVGNRLRGANML
jgi:regulator of protease activity HflC (stomatin/prohibitin superfamily)